MNVLFRDLSLGFRNFFNKDPGHWIAACVGVITSTVSSTISDPESHAHLAFMDVVTESLNTADAMGIFTTSVFHVNNTVNWKELWTLSTVESEIPAFTAVVIIGDSQSTSPVNMKGSVREVLAEHTVLYRIKNEEKWKEPMNNNATSKSIFLKVIIRLFISRRVPIA